ncbi:SpoIIE family protein phosphatase [Blastococcus saxobsidens]|uniref:Serine phosphatase RsbU, regulator of sigma subunit n=1 Tax=Blastococcus saxobsidens (strain DD2) TaxID=1146883 RepID=H6RQG2_BLASD|nr:SpoIIE family protein phosphatase [Blastococcus saxobsidens]CCG05330.1 Serine phosphatase RsbU, regulator of sigma subunit [Blastococcus saxobsidens DD2]
MAEAGRGVTPTPGDEALPGTPPWYSVLHDSSFMFAAVCDTAGTLLTANELAVEGCGFDRHQQLGRPFWRAGWWAGDPELGATVRGWCLEVAAGGEPVRAVTGFFLADGEKRTADLTMQLVREGDQQEFLLITGMDITDRLQTERVTAEARAAGAEASTLRQVATARAQDLEVLRETEAKLSRALTITERVLANVADGIYGLDIDGRVEFLNPAAARLTGYGAARQLGQDQHALIHAHRPDGSPYPHEECPVWRALRTGRTVVADEETFWRRDGTPMPVEMVVVPTVEDGVLTGVVVSFRDLTDRLAAQRQAAELEALAARAAADRALSDRLQQSLLTPPPEPDHLQIAVRYSPAAHEAQVGGDWYDAFLQPDGATMLVIGDVVGHDSSAAAAMGQIRGLLRALAYDDDQGPAATITRVEHTALGLAVSTLATAVLARIERHPDAAVAGRRLLRWSNAGHLPPVLLAPDGTSTLLTSPPELMLGIDPDAARSDHTVDLPDLHTLLLVTDGLVERRDTDLDEGIERLREALRDLGETPLEELLDTVLARLVPEPGADDVAIVAVRTFPEDRARPAEAGPTRLPPGVE